MSTYRVGNHQPQNVYRDGRGRGAVTDEADARPDWADQTRGQCRVCRDWPKLTKAGLVVKHMRSEPGRWHKVPCEGSSTPPLSDPAAPATAPDAPARDTGR